jgi:hypothetical protein
VKARNRVSGKVPSTSIDMPGSAMYGVVQYVALVSGKATFIVCGVVSSHHEQ